MIRGCIILSSVHEKIISKGVIAVKDGRIINVCTEEKAPPINADEIIDAEGKVAMPGLINCHTHTPMSILRGVAEDQELEVWLEESIWPLEAKLTASDVYYGALLSCLEMIKNGVTCFADMYFYEEEVAKAVKESGLRAVLAPGILEAGDMERGERMLKDAIRIYKRYNGLDDNRILVWLGPHAIYSCSLSLLKTIRNEALSLRTGIHIHLAESRETVDLVKSEYGKREVPLLKDIGFLGSDVLAAHGIYLNPNEMLTLAKYQVRLSYNPVSNMKLASGTPRIKDMLDLGIIVGFGTDGPASNNSLDIFETMKVGSLLQKVFYRDPRVLPVKKTLEMATLGGAEALGLNEIIGTLKPGKRADIILVDLQKPNMVPAHNLYANLVYSCRGSNVNTVIVNGKILMKNRVVITLDEDQVIKNASRIAERLFNSRY